MQYHDNGFRPGDPEIQAAAPGRAGGQGPLPDKLDVLIVGSGPAGLTLAAQLAAFPEVPEVLARLKAAGLQTAILSNGSPDMLEGAVKSAGIGGSLDAVLSVESVGVFKPHASVYDLVVQQMGLAPGEVLFEQGDEAREIGAGWKRTGERAGDYVALQIDDPSFVQPLRANLFNDDGTGHVLVWSRPSRHDKAD